MSARVPADTRVPVAFVDQTGDESGGAQESLALLLTHLPADIRPTVILFHEGAYAARLRAANLDVRIFPVAADLATSTRERPGVRGAAQLVPAIARLAGFLRSGRFRVVHTNTVKSLLVGAAAARIAGIPCVVHLRDLLDGNGRRALQMVAASCSRERIAISGSVARCYGLAGTHVIQNPVDLAGYSVLPERSAARAALGLPREGLVIGIVGRINRWKGQDIVLRTTAALRGRVPIHCAIIGEPRFRDADFAGELREFVAQERMSDCVTFVPWIDDPRIAFAAMDVHVNASEREPFGRTVVEAAAAGVPTVCFDDAGVAELMDGSSGTVVPAGDEGAFTREVERYASDAALRERTAASARVWAANFAAPRHADRVAVILRQCAA